MKVFNEKKLIDLGCNYTNELFILAKWLKENDLTLDKLDSMAKVHKKTLDGLKQGRNTTLDLFIDDMKVIDKSMVEKWLSGDEKSKIIDILTDLIDISYW